MSLLSLYILCENCIYALHNHIVCKAIIAINPKNSEYFNVSTFHVLFFCKDNNIFLMLDNNRITFYYKNSLYICNVKQM